MSKFTLENEAFASFAKYGGISLLKMVLMSPITGMYRRRTHSLMNPEDVRFIVGVEDEERIQNILARKNPELERIRAAHRNDMENIVPFALISLLYLSTDPDKDTACLLFKAFATLRILHTVVYLGKVRQPVRASCFLGGLAINLFMLYKTLKSTW